MEQSVKLGQSVNLFISYAPSDEEMKNELEGHITKLKRSGRLYEWNAQKAQSGGKLIESIYKGLKQAADNKGVIVIGDALNDAQWKRVIDELEKKISKK